MKNIRSFLILLISAFTISSCTHHNVYINRAEDNAEGEAVLKKIYGDVANKDLDGLDNMVSDSLKKLAGPKGISQLVEFINKKVGNYKSYTIVDHYNRSITGSTNETSYNYKLKVTYDKGVIDETIGLRKKDGSEIKINSYHANSDLLMK